MKLTVSPGTVVADRFSISRFIAEGGMGEVYEARDMILEENIAIKFLSRRNIGDENVTRRFHREIQLARKVTHPNVCRLFDVYQTPIEVPQSLVTVPVTFVTMELLHGETLEDRLQRDGAMSEEEALPIVVQMAQALTAAHDAGVIHRDFKSNNVMLEKVGDALRVVVTDFGLARSVLPGDPSRTPLTADQLILGTAEYMAPEQIKGDPVSFKSDLYALGVVLFEMVTSRKPYEAVNPMQLLVKRVSEPPARPRDFRPELSEKWESVIVACLAESPADRPASANEIIERLGGFAPRLQPTPSGELMAEKLAAARRPNQARWLTLAIVALAAVAFWASRDKAPPPGPGIFNPQRMTTAAGLELDPAFSPDATQMVYSGENDDGTFSLFVQPLDASSRPHRLDTGTSQAFEPDWAPKGNRIAFSTTDPGGIWLTTAEGKVPELVIERGSRPAFSPDGKLLAYQTETSPLLSDTTVSAVSPSVIGLIDLETRSFRELTHRSEPEGGHGDPTWTPSGRHLVFSVTSRSSGELWAVEVASGTLIPLLREPAKAYDPVVSGDGRTVYFSFRSLEVKTLWRLDVDPETLEPRGEPEEIAGVGLSSIRQPRLSRDGRHLLFAGYITRSNLWRLGLDSEGQPVGAPQALTSGNDRYNRPAFSPLGDQLVFDHWKLGVDIDLYLRSAELVAPIQQLTTRLGTNSHGSWLPDGRLAYTASNADGSKSVRVVDPETEEDSALLDLESDADWAVVSPLGDRLAFHSTRGGQGLDIWIQDFGGKPAWRLTFHDQAASFPTWSPDGTHLAYQVREGTGTDIWIASLDGSEPRPLVTGVGESWPYSFSPDGSKILFCGRRNASWNLFWVDIASQKVERLTENLAVTGYLRYPTWSPRGDQVVYEKAETAADLFLVRDFLPSR